MLKLGLLIGIGILGYFFQKLEEYLARDFDEIIIIKRWSPILSILVIEVLGVMILSQYKGSLEQIGFIGLMMVLVFLAIFDAKYMLLPSKIIYFSLLLGVLFQGARSFYLKDPYYMINSLLGCVIGVGLFGTVFYGTIWILKKEGLGFGDVRLIGVIGLYLGVDYLFITIILASLCAAIVGGIFYLIRRKSEAFPFGPSICIAGMIMVLYGNSIISFYYKCMG